MSRLQIVEWLTALAPTALVIVLAVFALALVPRWFERGGGRRTDQVFRRQMASIRARGAATHSRRSIARRSRR